MTVAEAKNQAHVAGYFKGYMTPIPKAAKKTAPRPTPEPGKKAALLENIRKTYAK